MKVFVRWARFHCIIYEGSSESAEAAAAINLMRGRLNAFKKETLD